MSALAARFFCTLSNAKPEGLRPYRYKANAKPEGLRPYRYKANAKPEGLRPYRYKANAKPEGLRPYRYKVDVIEWLRWLLPFGEPTFLGEHVTIEHIRLDEQQLFQLLIDHVTKSKLKTLS